jgi:hypothetical protein
MPSTVIRRFDYDPRTEALDVEFVSGRCYRYAAVPEAVATAFREAFSKGRFVTARIRPLSVRGTDARAGRRSVGAVDTRP